MAARDIVATALATRASGMGFWRSERHQRGRVRVRCARSLSLLSMAAILIGGHSAEAASNKVRLTKLTDVGFGTVANLSSDAVQSQSVCLYADTNTNGYNVTGIGTGPGGSFQLSSGAASMAFDVLWSSSTGQTSGIQLSPNAPLTGQVSPATHQTCATGPATSASLVIVLRSMALSSAAAGTYSGSLTLLIGPE